MKKYKVYISKEARIDLKEIADYIADILKAPLTAKLYTNGIVTEILLLRNNAESKRISNTQFMKKFGHKVRRVNFKKHSIIYTVQGTTVVIRRIIIGSMIKSKYDKNQHFSKFARN